MGSNNVINGRYVGSRFRKKRNSFPLLFLINLPLIVEVFRKYIWQSDIPLFLMVVIVFFYGLIILARDSNVTSNIKAGFFLSAAALIIIAFINQFLSSNSIMVFAIGIGTMFVPFFYAVCSANYYQKYANASISILKCANAWIILSLLVAALQLYFGKNSEFTQYGLGSSGIGDYTAEGADYIEGLFRPTSIFTHTGKFGQVVFCLILFKWVYFAVSRTKLSVPWKLSIVADFALILISGQRSAFLFLFISMFVLMFYTNLPMLRKSVVSARRYKRSFMLLLTVVFILTIGANFVSSNVYDMVVSRMISVFYDIPERVAGNLVYPFWNAINQFVFVGMGLGAITLGASKYGGVALYDINLGENSWVRIAAELGFLGFTIYVLMVSQWLYMAFRVSRRDTTSPNSASKIFFVLWYFSMFLWANTHDVFSNIIGMSLGFALGGAILEGRRGMSAGKQVSVLR